MRHGVWVKWVMAFLVAAGVLLVSKTQAAESQKANPSFTNQTLPMPAPNPRDDTDSESWRLVVAPYLWALGMNGSVQIKGHRAPLSESFSDILNQLNWAGMLFLEAYKGKFGVFINALYASLSDGASDSYISAHVNTNFGLYSAGLSYEIYKTCLCSSGCTQGGSTFAVTPYIGARYTSNNLQLTVNTPLGNIHASDDKHWTDPIIGARLNFDLTQSWLLNFAGDIGGTNTTSDYSYNLVGLIGFRPQTILRSTTWYLGYRYLDQHYSTGSSSNYYYWNMKLSGPLVGISFTF